MIKLPDNLTNPAFESKFKRGVVIKTSFRCDDGREKPKYFVVASRITDKEPIALLITTSQLDFYNRNPRFNTDILKIEANSLPYFDKDTVINCREIHKISKKTLRVNYNKRILDFEGELPSEYMDKIDDIVKNSRLISKRDKILVIDEDV